MKQQDKPEMITGKSYLQKPVETNTDIIKENKLTILNHVIPRKTEPIPEQETPPSTRAMNKTLRLSKFSYTSTMCVQQ